MPSASDGNGKSSIHRLSEINEGPVFSYNVPQAVSYSGQHYIELVLEPGAFAATAQGAQLQEGGE